MLNSFVPNLLPVRCLYMHWPDMLVRVLMIFPPTPATNRRLDSAKKGEIKMQKSGIKFWELMPRTIVPLDSAFVNLVYTAYFSAFDVFLQVIKLGVCLLDCHVN